MEDFGKEVRKAFDFSLRGINGYNGHHYDPIKAAKLQIMKSAIGGNGHTLLVIRKKDFNQVKDFLNSCKFRINKGYLEYLDKKKFEVIFVSWTT